MTAVIGIILALFYTACSANAFAKSTELWSWKNLNWINVPGLQSFHSFFFVFYGHFHSFSCHLFCLRETLQIISCQKKVFSKKEKQRVILEAEIYRCAL